MKSPFNKRFLSYIMSLLNILAAEERNNMSRLIALMILVLPGVLAVYGIKLMRDMVFGILQSPFPSLPLQFVCGLLFVILGIGFIAGFILHRDRKRNKVQDRFKKES